MIEKLKAYREELLNAKIETEQLDNTAAIDAKVAEYRAELVAEDAQKKAVTIAKINSDIDCIDYLISREEAKQTAEVAVTEPQSIGVIEQPTINILR